MVKSDLRIFTVVLAAAIMPGFGCGNSTEKTARTSTELPNTVLSNGMIIEEGLIVSFRINFEGARYYKIKTGFGDKFDLDIRDSGDGRPYARMPDGKEVYELTYPYGPHKFPIWKPTAFRETPEYEEAVRKMFEPGRK